MFEIIQQIRSFDDLLELKSIGNSVVEELKKYVCI